MSQGFATTIRLLSKTQNEAAVLTLVAGLNSRLGAVREASLAAILSRRNPAAHREVLRRLHTLDERSKTLIQKHQGRMTQALRDALLDTDPQLCANGCRAAAWMREYDLIPALITALEDASNPHAEIAGKTLLELAALLYGELATPRGDSRRRDTQVVRHRVVGDLERSVGRFGRHKRRQIIEAFLLLVKRDNVTLKAILMDPRSPAFVVLTDVLSHSTSGGVIRLLLTYLDDPHAPSVTISAAAKRTDVKFVRHMLRKIGREPSAAVKQNLKRIKSVSWTRDGFDLIDELDEPEQHAVVRLIMNSGIPRNEAFAAIEHLLVHGKAAGRRAAAEALTEFPGAEANRLALGALDDEDPQAQASVIRQLRHRGIPGVLPRLVKMVDSPHAVVRRAVRDSLAEFSFARFLAAFDMLDDEVRRSTGTLVKKIDPQTLPRLEAEMQSQARTRRLRAVTIAGSIGAIPAMEAPILRLLDDEDHLIRMEAALALGECESLTSRDALGEALEDRSVSVRDAAQTSLDRRIGSADQREVVSEP